MKPVIFARPLADQIYTIILEAICNGQYRVNERLSQEQIAHSLDVSRQPVLQALGLLKSQGFLYAAGRRGLAVAPLDVNAVRDLYEYRSAIDLLAASKAAQLCTSEQAKEGQRILQSGETARKVRSLIDLSLADMMFHQWIYQIAQNRTVIETMNHYWNHIRRVMCAILDMDDEWPGRVWDEHEAIYDAIVSAKSELAEHLAREHVKKSFEALQLRMVTKQDD